MSSVWLQIFMGVFSGIVAAGWVLWRYVIAREGVWNMQISVQHTEYPYGSLRLLVLRIGLKNIGKVKITPSPNGCRLSIREIPSGASAGVQLQQDAGDVILSEVDILKSWWREDIGYKNYEIEPGCEYNEICTVVVEPERLLEVKIVFAWEGFFAIPFLIFIGVDSD